MAKKKRGGVLRTMRDGTKKKSKKPGLVRRIAGWLGGALSIAALLVVLYLLGMQMYNPRVDSLPLEAEATVEALLEDGAVAQVTLPDGRILVRELYAGSSYISTESPLLHFGLGRFEEVPKVTVIWPDGSTTQLSNVTANQRLILSKENGP